MDNTAPAHMERIMRRIDDQRLSPENIREKSKDSREKATSAMYKYRLRKEWEEEASDRQGTAK